MNLKKLLVFLFPTVVLQEGYISLFTGAREKTLRSRTLYTSKRFKGSYGGFEGSKQNA